MKKLDLHLNFAEIKKRIEADKAQYGVGEWAKLVGTSIATISNIHGKKAKINPSIEYIVAVSRVTRKPVEWYLYGKPSESQPDYKVEESRPQFGSEEDLMSHWPEEIKSACRQLKEILLSDHPVIKPALLSNLAAFQYSVEKEKSQDEEIKNLNRRLQHLEEYHKAKQPTGTDGAASSSTGKKKT
jgi:hypothetical protein